MLEDLSPSRTRCAVSRGYVSLVRPVIGHVFCCRRRQTLAWLPRRVNRLDSAISGRAYDMPRKCRRFITGVNGGGMDREICVTGIAMWSPPTELSSFARLTGSPSSSLSLSDDRLLVVLTELVAVTGRPNVSALRCGIILHFGIAIE